MIGAYRAMTSFARPVHANSRAGQIIVVRRVRAPRLGNREPTLFRRPRCGTIAIGLTLRAIFASAVPGFAFAISCRCITVVRSPLIRPSRMTLTRFTAPSCSANRRPVIAPVAFGFVRKSGAARPKLRGLVIRIGITETGIARAIGHVAIRDVIVYWLTIGRRPVDILPDRRSARVVFLEERVIGGHGADGVGALGPFVWSGGTGLRRQRLAAGERRSARRTDAISRRAATGRRDRRGCDPGIRHCGKRPVLPALLLRMTAGEDGDHGDGRDRPTAPGRSQCAEPNRHADFLAAEI